MPKPRVLYSTYEEMSSMKDLNTKRTAVSLQERTYLSVATPPLRSCPPFAPCGGAVCWLP